MAIQEIAGVELGIDCFGSGAPTLIFVHGGFCNRHDWDAQVRALAPHFRLVTLDMPGHGESGKPAQATVAALAQAVSGIKTLYGGERAILIGHSLGVDVSLEAFRQSPAGIAGMVLIDGGLVADGDPDRAVEAFKENLLGIGFMPFINASFGQMFTPASDPALRLRVLARLQLMDQEFAQQIILSKIRWDASQAARVLAAVNVPVLLLQSTYFDATFERRSLEPGMTTPWTEIVTRHVSGAEVHCVPNVGHFAQIEAPDIVTDHIRRFAERIRSAG